jgi:hypothetical protein
MTDRTEVRERQIGAVASALIGTFSPYINHWTRRDWEAVASGLLDISDNIADGERGEESK